MAGIFTAGYRHSNGRNRLIEERQPKQDRIVPRRMMTNPYSIWPVAMFHTMLDRICNEEMTAVVVAGRPEPTNAEREEMRQFVAFNINAHVVPAGNA